MSNFIDELMKTYGRDMSSHISKNLGLSSKTVKKIIPHIVPVILGGLKKQKDEKGGIENVEHILNKFGGSNIFDNISDLFKDKAKDENPDPNLGGLLGDSGDTAAMAIAKKFNIDGIVAKKLIAMVAPVIFGALIKKKNDEGLGVAGISALLDRDGDGSILDDVAGFLGGAFNKSGSKGAGLVGNILGGIFGKKNK